MPEVWRVFELRVSVSTRGNLLFQRVCRFVQPLAATQGRGPLRLIFVVREIDINWDILNIPRGYDVAEDIAPWEIEDFLERYIGPEAFVSSGFVIDGPDEAR
jgi:hypothetical protein